MTHIFRLKDKKNTNKVFLYMFFVIPLRCESRVIYFYFGIC